MEQRIASLPTGCRPSRVVEEGGSFVVGLRDEPAEGFEDEWGEPALKTRRYKRIGAEGGRGQVFRGGVVGLARGGA